MVALDVRFIPLVGSREQRLVGVHRVRLLCADTSRSSMRAAITRTWIKIQLGASEVSENAWDDAWTITRDPTHSDVVEAYFDHAGTSGK